MSGSEHANRRQLSWSRARVGPCLDAGLSKRFQATADLAAELNREAASPAPPQPTPDGIWRATFRDLREPHLDGLERLAAEGRHRPKPVLPADRQPSASSSRRRLSIRL